jgi:hypothetical protein
MRKDNGTSDREFILLRLIPRGLLIAYTRADRRGFNMINVIKIVGEVATPKLIGK